MRLQTITALLLLTACSPANGRDGRDGTDGTEGLQGVPGAPGEKGATIVATVDASAPGEKGAQGEKGDIGETGPQGPAGMALPLTKSKLYTVLSPVASLAGASAPVAVSASCTLASDILIAGGCETHGAIALLVSSYPESAADPLTPSAWICAGTTNGSGNAGHTITARAVCASP